MIDKYKNESSELRNNKNSILLTKKNNKFKNEISD